MNFKTTCLLLGVLPLLASCASQPIALAPVGPSPFAGRSSSSMGAGYLQVFSDLEAIDEGDNPSFFQHTDYNIYNGERKLVKHVDNTVGHYETSPRLVSLRPGTYIIVARAKEWMSVEIPVAIVRGGITKVHLDENWQPPARTPKTDVVCAPDGYPVGWRANLPIGGTKTG